ncbi:ABC transporter ATP-binding protein [Gordonia sp. (in: high G+C Gram-positive bacteria)]|jgi:NitT/TauT family transport system ATP-binding protein|uniref:ABC transporter ATP-binding protein n=1 Tax=Gordonia sp. (in: high G+C Gram-positive bacteria) TaxID=84139 RepID=UPI0025BFB300|nr:ABC transporter ATP-binding protein [Gordonia sp. (in: high G+C Gram-positive bacteria)]HMS75189.1 ABC transporter ATP-binding protein [Gordonia sp. (in: high G+C Gram-positive bacteria)]HQV18332.1 ABC transporter ATP-binding protein [Gordonia sp. (in: high G+C Gram-positive bacteria)]
MSGTVLVEQQTAAAGSAIRAPRHATPKIVARKVSKLYPKPGSRKDVTAVLDGFDLTINDGEFLSLLGPSGCGKSTFLNILAGLDSYNGGSVHLDGQQVTGVNKNVGVVFQGYALFPWLTAQKNVEVGLKIRGVGRAERRERAAEVLKTVGLSAAADRLPHQLSGGMRQRAAIARVLAYDPEVLVFDEPFAALDAQTREFLQGELLRIWESGENKKTILFVTHSIDEAIFLSDRIAVMTKSPGAVKTVLDVDLDRPRTQTLRSSEDFAHIRARVAGILAEEVNVGNDAA